MQSTEEKRLIINSDIASNTLSNTQIGLAASITGTPSNPTGTTSTTAVMAGLAISFTPNKTGKIKITVDGMIANSTAGDGGTAQIAYGTGTAPANGAAATGTAVGNKASLLSSAASQNQSFSLVAIVSGLTAGTAYWIDLQQAAVTGGTASITGISYTVEELLA